MRKIRIVLILISIATIIIAGFYGVEYYRHHQPIPAGAVTLELPLKNGTFYVTVSGQTRTMHTSVDQKYALDIIRMPKISEWFRFRNTSLEANSTYDTPVYSPCSGNIKKTFDGVADQPIGIASPENSVGNAIIMGCDGGFNVMMAHFKAGTIKVKTGDRVKVGDQIAQIGNSGNSGGPHLHIDAFRFGNSTSDVIPLPIIFNGQYFLTGDSFKN
jgi:murein DD-endopeptidase MepM/ murein hydrolase activator NlpD